MEYIFFVHILIVHTYHVNKKEGLCSPNYNDKNRSKISVFEFTKILGELNSKSIRIDFNRQI